MKTIRYRLMFTFTALCVCGIALAQVPQAKEQSWTTTEDNWYVMELGGSKAGWVHSLTQTSGDQIKSTSETQMKLNRGGMTIEITMKSGMIETAAGKPVEMTMDQLMSLQNVQSRWVFHEDRVEMITNQGGREIKSDQPLPSGEWLTMKAAERFAKTKRQEGAEEFSFRTLNPQTGVKPMMVTSKFKGKETVDVNGKPTEVTVWSSITDVMPVESIEKVDSDGRMVYQEVSLAGLGKMVTRLSTKEAATGEGGGGDIAPEMLVQTFVAPNKPIDNPRKVVRSKLRLTAKEGKLPELPTAGAQRVEMSSDGKSALLTLDINNNVAASAADIDNKEFTTASAMIDSGDELIQKLAKRASEREEGSEAAEDDAMKRAEALRRLVRRHINKKGMATAFASASETAKMRTGDCSEHGVMLAALLRADGIPARVATGLVYADAFEGHEHIFGWHMWTQALINGEWVDFDATLPVRFDGTHILTATSSLADGLATTEMASIVQLLGNLEIEVVELAHE